MTNFKPFTYPWAYDAWLKSEQMHWLHTEVPLNEDLKDFNLKLTETEKQFLTHLFRFFTQADLDVAGAYVKGYLPYYSQPELRMMLSSFSAREALHVAAYSHLIETLGLPETTYNEFMQYQAMVDKHTFFESIGYDNDPLIKLAVFSAFSEGMQLFSSFVMLLNFSRHGKMRGMSQIITWSIMDETLHTESMIKLFREEARNRIVSDETKGAIYSAASKMVELEDAFIDLAFGVNEMENLTSEQVKKYIRYIADRRLIAMGMKGIFGVKRNPLPWVAEMINAPIHGNFFENKVTDYAKGSIKGDWGEIWAS